MRRPGGTLLGGDAGRRRATGGILYGQMAEEPAGSGAQDPDRLSTIASREGFGPDDDPMTGPLFRADVGARACQFPGSPGGRQVGAPA